MTTTENGHRPTIYVEVDTKRVQEGEFITQFRESAEWVIFTTVAKSPDGKPPTEIKAAATQAHPEVQLTKLTNSVDKINKKFSYREDPLIHREGELYFVNANVIFLNESS